MNRKELTKRYWRYYLMLEKRFIGSIEYVALDKKNYPTFSNEYALLIQAIGAELDTVFKVFNKFRIFLFNFVIVILHILFPYRRQGWPVRILFCILLLLNFVLVLQDFLMRYFLISGVQVLLYTGAC